MINVNTHDRFVRKDPRRGDREFFVAGVQPDLEGRGGGGSSPWCTATPASSSG